MAITLDNLNEIKTNYYDFVDALKKLDNGLRCCFDIDMLVYEYTPTSINEIKLVPLDEFRCKRTIVGVNGTNIGIESSFGITDDDFINVDVNHVEVVEKDKYKLSGVLIPTGNHYFGILNQLAQYFDMVKKDNENSFVLDESDLSVIKLVPFTLKFEKDAFIVSDIEQEMKTSEFDELIDKRYSNCMFL